MLKKLNLGKKFKSIFFPDYLAVGWQYSKLTAPLPYKFSWQVSQNETKEKPAWLKSNFSKDCGFPV